MTRPEIVPGVGIEGWVIPHGDCLLGAFIEVGVVDTTDPENEEKDTLIEGHNLGIRGLRTETPKLFVLQPEALLEIPLSEIRPDKFHGGCPPDDVEYWLPEFVDWYRTSPPETHLVNYCPEQWPDYYQLPNGECDLVRLRRSSLRWPATE
jgi:hypothetical protein